MPKLKITQAVVNDMRHPDEGQVFYWDTEKTGFGVRIGKKRKAYIFQRDVRGKSERHTIGDCSFMKLAKAKREADKLTGTIADGVSPRDSEKAYRAEDMTLRKAWELYQTRLTAKKRAPRTGAGYWRNLNRYCEDWVDRPIIEITRVIAHERHRMITEAHGPYAANATMKALRAIWNRARKRHEKLPESPTVDVEWNPEDPRKKVIRTEDKYGEPVNEMAIWYSAIEKLNNPIRRSLYIFLLFTGCRSEEARTLRWENVNLERGVIHFDETKTEPFDLPLSDFLIDLLKQRRDCKETNAEFQNSPWVFPADSKTGHISEAKLSAREKRDFPVPFSPHVLRHTYITISENRVSMPEKHRKLLVNHGRAKDEESHARYNHPGFSDLCKSQQAMTNHLRIAIVSIDGTDNVVGLHA